MLYRKVPVTAGDPVIIPGPPETAQAMQDWLQQYLPQLIGDAQVAPNPRSHTPQIPVSTKQSPQVGGCASACACMHMGELQWGWECCRAGRR